MGAQDGIIAPLQFGYSVFQLQANSLQKFQVFLLAMRLAGVNQPVDPPMAAEQTIEIIIHSDLRLRHWLI